MIEFWLLLFGVVVLYVVECAVWVPAGSIAFRLPYNPRPSSRIIRGLRVEPRPSIAFNYPFVPLSEVIVASELPIAISPEGIVANPSFAVKEKAGEFIPFERMLQVEAEQRRLLINGLQFVTTSSDVQAARLANFLRLAKKMNSKDRTRKIEGLIARSLDADSVDKRFTEFEDKTSDLRLDSLGLLAAIFLISPIFVWRWKLAAIWPFLLTYLVVNVALIAWDLHRANRELFPDTSINRWTTIAIIMLSPPAALRAVKYLANDIGNEFHPLAFAASRCSKNAFRSLASQVLRDLMFRTDSDSEDKRSGDCTAWFRRMFYEATLALVRNHGDDPDQIITPHSRESEHVHSYCPRCLSQFVMTEGVCADCGGRIPLRSFEPEPFRQDESTSTH